MTDGLDRGEEQILCTGFCTLYMLNVNLGFVLRMILVRESSSLSYLSRVAALYVLQLVACLKERSHYVCVFVFLIRWLHIGFLKQIR